MTTIFEVRLKYRNTRSGIVDLAISRVSARNATTAARNAISKTASGPVWVLQSLEVAKEGDKWPRPEVELTMTGREYVKHSYWRNLPTH